MAQQKPVAAQRGGPREGAGRKPTGRTERLTVTMTPDVRAELERFGDGNVSVGIERAVIAARAAPYAERLHLATIDLAHALETHVLAVTRVREALDAAPGTGPRLSALLGEQIAEVQALLREIRRARS